jgi:acetylornithine deacetylase
MDMDATQRSTLKTHIETKRQHYMAVLRDLLAASANGEEALQQEVGRHFQRLGCQIETVINKPNDFALNSDFATELPAQSLDRVSVVGTHPGAGQGRNLLVFAHPDSEPVVHTDTWQHGPFAGEIDGDRMYGWGIADDLSGVAAMICALESIQTAELRLLGDVTIASTASKRRAQGIYAVLERGYSADAAIYLHPAESGAGLGDIKAISSGILQFRITVTGQPPPTTEPTHTPFYHQAINPIDKAWIIYHALTELAEQRAQQVHHPAFAQIGRSTNLNIAHINSGEAARASRVASTAVMVGSLTFPPNEDIADVQGMVNETVQRASENDPWLRDHPAQLEWLMGTSGVEVPLDGALYRTVASAIENVTGISPGVQSLHSGSEIRAPIHFKDIPTVGFGPLAGDLTQSGGADEWVSVDDYIRMIEVVVNIIVEWCSVSR